MTNAELQARIDELEKRPHIERPWWAPDAQGFVIGTVVFYIGVTLFWRMTHPVEINDKQLDMMLTILYGTAFVGLCNFLWGSSRGSQAKDDNRDKVVDKLMATVAPIGTGNGSIMAAATAAAPAAAAIAAPPAAAVAAPPAVDAELDARGFKAAELPKV